MNIVVLDGYALNPGDLSWEPLKRLGDVTIYEYCDKSEVLNRLIDAEIVIVNKVQMTKEIIKSLPHLRAILVTATGYNNIDLVQTAKQGISVHNVPAYSTNSVVQLIFSFILHFARQIVVHDTSVQNHKWEETQAFCFWDTPQIELNGKNLGIIGYGNIGQATAKIAQAFGMNVLVSSRRVLDVEGITFVSQEELFRKSDFITLTCALTADTDKLVNNYTLSLMKPSAYLINTGRGPLIDEEALVQALSTGLIAGAAVDVLTAEPPTDGSILIGTPNCVVTPHIGWATIEARQRCMDITCNNVRGVLDNKPINVVGL